MTKISYSCAMGRDATTKRTCIAATPLSLRFPMVIGIAVSVIQVERLFGYDNTSEISMRALGVFGQILMQITLLDYTESFRGISNNDSFHLKNGDLIWM